MSLVTLFQLAVTLTGALVVSAGALWYHRNARLERPPIGVFNGRDVVVLGVFVVMLPLVYIVVPGQLLTVLLVITFLSAWRITLRPLLSARVVAVVVPVVIVADILVTHWIAELPAGVQLYWLINGFIVAIAAIGIGNLYVQGGLTLRHVAVFCGFLAVYDVIVTAVLPLTATIAASFIGRPLDPFFGFQVPGAFGGLGIGDLLTFALFAAAADRFHGRRGARVALTVIVIFGAVIPILLPTLLRDLGLGLGGFVPVQVFFGPAVVAAYLWLSRRSAPGLARSTNRRSPAPRVRARGVLPATAFVALVLATAFATGEDATTDARASVGPQTARIPMKDLAFQPDDRVVAVGQTVVWENEDLLPHDVVATSGASFRSQQFDRGGTFRFEPTKPGVIRYVCTLHPGMEGTLRVVG
jgi:plastocyanin